VSCASWGGEGSSGATQLAGGINGFSTVILDVFGSERGAHARAVVGMSELPYGVAVEIEAERVNTGLGLSSAVARPMRRTGDEGNHLI
jgi:hypothetical protein